MDLFLCSIWNFIFGCTSVIVGRHIEDCLTQYEAVSTTLCSCSTSYSPCIPGSASFAMSPDSIRGFACTCTQTNMHVTKAYFSNQLTGMREALFQVEVEDLGG